MSAHKAANDDVAGRLRHLVVAARTGISHWPNDSFFTARPHHRVTVHWVSANVGHCPVTFLNQHHLLLLTATHTTLLWLTRNIKDLPLCPFRPHDPRGSRLFPVTEYSTSTGRVIDRARRQLSPGPLQATSSKSLTYCVLRPTQPPTLSEMGNE